METESDIILLDNGKHIGVIKISKSNNNPPYVIKETCGKSNKIEKGDIYIRKGSCNLKASRSDIDQMYVNNGEVIVRFHENLAIVEPIHLEGKIVDNPTYGHIDVELFNDTTRPILIDRGIIC